MLPLQLNFFSTTIFTLLLKVLNLYKGSAILVALSDNGFYVSGSASFKASDAIKMLRADKLELIMKTAIENSEVLKRRFRHCATRSLMILRNYMGREKRVGRQQVSSMILMSALKRISNDFSVLKEARREVLEDLMDIDNAKKVIQMINDGANVLTIGTNLARIIVFLPCFW